MLTEMLRSLSTHRVLAGGAAIALALSRPAPALATSPCEVACACPHLVPEVPLVSYQRYAEIPTNARFFIPLPGEGEGTLVVYPESDPEAAIPLIIEEKVAGARAAWARPEKELAPWTAYVLEASWDGVEPTERDRQPFSTGHGPDTKAPTPLAAAIEPIPDGETCDPLLGFVVAASPELWQAQDLVRLDIAVPGQPERVLFVDAQQAGRIVIGDSPDADGYCAVEEGSGDRGTAPSLPGAELGQKATVSLTLFDTTGHASPTTVLSDVPIREAAAGELRMDGACCGCRSAGVDPGSADLVVVPLGALVLLLRRRRLHPGKPARD